MEQLHNTKKAWVNPSVQILNINRDTYTSDQNKLTKESGKGDAANIDKLIPS